jgi:hypothetical protein
MLISWSTEELGIMNRAEAKGILDQKIISLQAKSFEDLQKLIKSPEIVEQTGASGVSYQIEVQAFWDNPKERFGDLRVIALIDDGRFFSALVPLSVDFIIGSDGKVK